MHDLGSQHGKELADPGRVRGPSGGRDELAVSHCPIDSNFGIFAMRQLNLGAAGGIGRTSPPFKHTLAAARTWAPWQIAATVLSARKKCMHGLDYLWIHSKIFWGTSGRYEQGIIGLKFDVRECRIEFEWVGGRKVSSRATSRVPVAREGGRF